MGDRFGATPEQIPFSTGRKGVHAERIINPLGYGGSFTADVNHRDSFLPPPPPGEKATFDCVIDRLIKQGFLHWIKRGRIWRWVRVSLFFEGRVNWIRTWDLSKIIRFGLFVVVFLISRKRFEAGKLRSWRSKSLNHWKL